MLVQGCCLPIDCGKEAAGGAARTTAGRMPKGVSVGGGKLSLPRAQKGGKAADFARAAAVPASSDVRFCAAFEVISKDPADGIAAAVAVNGELVELIEYSGETGRKDMKVDLKPFLKPGPNEVEFLAILINTRGFKTRAARVMVDIGGGRELASHECFQTSQEEELHDEVWQLDVQ
jgi:hypothetical protein